MGVSVTTLKAEIEAAFKAEKDQTENQEASIERIATRIAMVVAEQIVKGIDSSTITFVLAAPTGAVEGEIFIKGEVENEE